MTTTQIKWMLFLIPALVIGGFETIRHTLLENALPMELGNWVTALIDAFVIALVSRTLLHQYGRLQKELGEEKQAHAVFTERERLAMVLHDEIAQSIFYSGVQLNTAKELASNCNDNELSVRLNDVTSSLREIDENLRQAIFNLRHETLEETDLCKRISSYFKRTLSEVNISWTLEFPEINPTLTTAEQVQLFGIIQESVTNIVKHSHASHVSVAFEDNLNEQGDWSFIIRDDGIGFHPKSSNTRGYGLNLMSSRARNIGAVLHVNSGANGTTVTVNRLLKKS